MNNNPIKFVKSNKKWNKLHKPCKGLETTLNKKKLFRDNTYISVI